MASLAGRLRSWVVLAARYWRELDDERVLVRGQWRGRGKTSGLVVGETPTQGASLSDLRDRKVTKLVLYWDCDRALADLGLASKGDHP
jgi:hypothetical protein